ncbi:2Fe-2S iron-sulfur cluster-binding protein [Streptomyces olindensis]|uniref:2Fe-2S iron-sulfur cluster-binding protein n=1 Tax=Streptomyces olindensis TaxID=358823 RepID=UPI0036AE7140
MTDDQHGEGTSRGGSRWDPLPQGEYDDGATAFVELPEGGVDALLAADSPLAAPGHGYVPPQITVSPATTAGTDPAATGAWPVPGAPVDGAQWHDPHDLHDPRDPHAAHQQGQDAGEQPYGSEAAYGAGAPYGSGTPYGTDAGARPHGGNDRFTYNPGTTGQWNFEEATAAEAAPGHDVTGQWSIPVAGGDLPDESGEFTTSSLVEQWGGTPPATLPGGAPAPWATQAAGQPWDRQPPQETAGQDQPGAGYPHGAEQGQGQGYDQGQGHGHGHAPEQGHGHGHMEGHGQPGVPGPASEYAVPGGHAPEQPPAAPLPQETDAAHGGHLPHETDPTHAAPLPHETGPGEATPGQPATGHAPEPSRFADLGAESPGFTDHAPEPSGYADDGAGHAGAVGHGPEPSEFPGHAPESTGFAGHPAEPLHFTDHGAEPSHFTGHDPERAGLPGHDPERAGLPGHDPERTGVHGAEDYPGPDTHAPEHPGASAHAPEHPGHAAHAPDQPAPAGHGAEQPYAEHPGEMPEEAAPSPEADAADPDGVGPAQAAQEVSQPSPGPGEPAEGVPGAAEGADGPAEPSAEALPAMADADAGPEAADAPGTDGETPGDPSPEEPAASHDTADTPDDPSAASQDGAPTAPQEEHPLASYVLRVNGTDRPVTDAWIGESLLYVLRERLGLAGAKDGCSQGECGACNVQVDGRLVASCLVPAVTAAGSEVRTVEGLAEDGQPSDVQRALARCGAVQCGFCVPGMAMTVHDLLEGNPAPTELETRQALCGNLCRCSGYRGVVDAVKEVVAEREAHAAPGEGDGDEPRIPHQAGPGAGGVNASAFGAPPEPHGQEPHSPEPHDQPYGQDGGQA